MDWERRKEPTGPAKLCLREIARALMIPECFGVSFSLISLEPPRLELLLGLVGLEAIVRLLAPV